MLQVSVFFWYKIFCVFSTDLAQLQLHQFPAEFHAKKTVIYIFIWWFCKNDSILLYVEPGKKKYDIK